MGISGTPGAASTNIRVLGSGTFTTGSSGTREDVGNFSTLGDIGNSIIKVEIQTFATGATSNSIGIHNATGNAATMDVSTDQPNSVNPIMCEFTLSKSFNSTTQGNIRSVQTITGTVSGKTAVSANFDFSAAEQVFLKVNANGINKGSWIAYQIYP